MRRRGLLCGAAFALAGCGGAAPCYYRLAAVPGAPVVGGPASIGVRSVGIPGYLDQSGIVQRAGPYQFDSFANELWAEPLADMLQAVMVLDLAQLFPRATVLASGGAIEGQPQMLVEINVQTFDPDGAGQMVLLAQVALKNGADHNLLTARTLSLSAPSGTSVTGTVAAMSQLWGQAAAQIAAMVAAA